MLKKTNINLMYTSNGTNRQWPHQNYTNKSIKILNIIYKRLKTQYIIYADKFIHKCIF